MKKIKVKIKDISTDPKLITLRPVNIVFVSRYRQAYRTGADFPLIIVDSQNLVVSGNHRYQAMLEEFGPDYEITVNQKAFKSEKDRLEFFAAENSHHGNPLDGISKKRIAVSMIEAGATQEDVARVFNVHVQKVIKWGDNCAMLVIGRGKTTPVPLKKGPDIEPGQIITRKEYKEHIQCDIGKSPFSIAEQLSRWLRNGWVKKTDTNLKCLRDLSANIDTWMDDRK